MTVPVKKRDEVETAIISGIRSFALVVIYLTLLCMFLNMLFDLINYMKLRYMPKPVRLSMVEIDVDKDWVGRSIYNVGTITAKEVVVTD